MLKHTCNENHKDKVDYMLLTYVIWQHCENSSVEIHQDVTIKRLQAHGMTRAEMFRLPSFFHANV